MKTLSTLLVAGFFMLCTVFHSCQERKPIKFGMEAEAEANGESKSNECGKCGGDGRIASWGACSDYSHFGGDCTPDSHGSGCASTGSKTCTCCNGSGKSN